MIIACTHCGRTQEWRRLFQRRAASTSLDGAWICSDPCLRSAIGARMRENQLAISAAAAPRPRLPLGLTLLQRGTISADELQQSVSRQRAEGGAIGAHLRSVAGLKEIDIAIAVARQWSVPYLELTRPPLAPSHALLPATLLHAAGAIVAHADPRSATIYVAFSRRIDRALLRAIQCITGLTALPCVARESVIAAALERLPRTRVITLPEAQDPDEAAHLAATYALEHGSNSVRLAYVHPYWWVRIRDNELIDLLCPMSARRDRAEPFDFRSAALAL